MCVVLHFVKSFVYFMHYACFLSDETEQARSPEFFALVANLSRALVRGLIRVGYREIRRKEPF